jgi:hypothetical protein
MTEQHAGDGRIVHACPGCGGAVECGMSNNDETCWCCELPHVLPISGSDAQCFCKTCLEKLIDQRKASSFRSGV